MLKEILGHWWTFVLRGVLAILFGLACTLAPGLTLSLLAFWAGIFILADGILGLIGTFANWKQLEEKWMLLLEAALNILLGWLIIRLPEASVMFVVLMMAIWAMLSGITRIAMAIRVRKEIKGEGWLIAGGVLTLLLGAILVMVPDIGVITLAWTLGFGALLLGIVLIVIGLRMRKLHKEWKNVG